MATHTTISVKRITNGFIISDDDRAETFCATLDEVFTDLLFEFEGRMSDGENESWGRVIICRDPSEQPDAMDGT